MIPFKPASRIALPDPGQLDISDADAVRTHLISVNAAIAQLSAQMMVSTQPVDQVLLMSPNGSTYKLTVNNAGVTAVNAVNVVP